MSGCRDSASFWPGSVATLWESADSDCQDNGIDLSIVTSSHHWSCQSRKHVLDVGVGVVLTPAHRSPDATLIGVLPQRILNRPSGMSIGHLPASTCKPLSTLASVTQSRTSMVTSARLRQPHHVDILCHDNHHRHSVAIVWMASAHVMHVAMNGAVAEIIQHWANSGWILAMPLEPSRTGRRRIMPPVVKESYDYVHCTLVPDRR
jgi:hypothetical protein